MADFEIQMVDLSELAASAEDVTPQNNGWGCGSGCPGNDCGRDCYGASCGRDCVGNSCGLGCTC